MIRSPFKLYKISGHSMEPTLKAGSFVLAYTWGRNFRPGDIVAFNYDGKIFIKRVESIIEGGFIVSGDNKSDSLHIDPIKKNDLIAKIVWF